MVLLSPNPDQIVAEILYVESDRFRIEMMKSVLALRPGWNLRFVAGVHLVMDLIRSHRPDLVVVAAQLPDGPGVLVVAAMKRDKATSRIPVVLLGAAVCERQMRRLLMGDTTTVTDVSDGDGEALSLLDALVVT